MKRTLMVSALAAVLILSSGFAFAADQDEQIYGSQLMTQQERTEYRVKMRAAKTAQEREQIRNEHHEQLKERAKERGVTLPDEPPVRGGGMGPGGGGMGHGGGGMGPGGGGMGHGWWRHGTGQWWYGSRWRRYGAGWESWLLTSPIIIALQQNRLLCILPGFVCVL